MSRVGLIGENSIGYISKLIDIWNNGDCAVLLDWRIPLATLKEMMLEANVSKCFVESGVLGKYKEKNAGDIVDNIELIAYDKEYNSAALLPQYVYDKFNENYSSGEAIVIYSSGTTGKSKGIILSHFAINTNADAIIDYMRPSKDDCIYMVKTISHASSLVGELLVSLKSRTPILVAPIIVPPRFIFHNISKYKVTILCINPTLLQMYMNEYENNKTRYELSSLRELYVHGAKASYGICDNASNVFNWCSIYYEYGLSEASPRVATQKLSSYSCDSVGIPIKNVQVKIVNQKQEIAQVNEYGIIHVNTPSKFLGYVCGGEKSRSLYMDWLNTGDVGYYDEYGELHVVGRADDVIVIDAHKVYPSEIEKRIVELSDICECVVAKVENNCNEYIGCLYVSNQKIDQDIKQKLKTRLLPYEIPRFFLRCDALPRNKNGKISRREVQTCLKEYINQE